MSGELRVSEVLLDERPVLGGPCVTVVQRWVYLRKEWKTRHRVESVHESVHPDTFACRFVELPPVASRLVTIPESPT